MSNKKAATITVDGTAIRLVQRDKGEYLNLTDMAKQFNDDAYGIIHRWLSNRNTVEFLGLWESLHNLNFNSLEFERIRNEAGLNSFYLTVKQWQELTGAVGIEARAGRYGGTYAHRDIAIQFATYLSPSFYLYLVKEFQRLQEERRETLDWEVKRILSKVNYRLHQEAVRLLMPPRLDTQGERYLFANEADLLNLAVFGITAAEWRSQNPNKEGNLRDYATPEQLVVLSNMEALNTELIKEGLQPDERLHVLNQAAIWQLERIFIQPNLDRLRGK